MGHDLNRGASELATRGDWKPHGRPRTIGATTTADTAHHDALEISVGHLQAGVHSQDDRRKSGTSGQNAGARPEEQIDTRTNGRPGNATQADSGTTRKLTNNAGAIHAKDNAKQNSNTGDH